MIRWILPEEDMKISPIGIINSPHRTKEECPIQHVYSSGIEGKITVFEEYASGIKDIEMFSHIYLLYLFDRAGKIELIRTPFLDDEPHGIFASRHPCRPNGIGLSIVRLLSREDNVMIVQDVDILDGTPLLDIKPYVPRFDNIGSASHGWYAEKQWRPKPPGRE